MSRFTNPLAMLLGQTPRSADPNAKPWEIEPERPSPEEQFVMQQFKANGNPISLDQARLQVASRKRNGFPLSAEDERQQYNIPQDWKSYHDIWTPQGDGTVIRSDVPHPAFPLPDTANSQAPQQTPSPFSAMSMFNGPGAARSPEAIAAYEQAKAADMASYSSPPRASVDNSLPHGLTPSELTSLLDKGVTRDKILAAPSRESLLAEYGLDTQLYGSSGIPPAVQPTPSPSPSPSPQSSPGNSMLTGGDLAGWYDTLGLTVKETPGVGTHPAIDLGVWRDRLGLSGAPAVSTSAAVPPAAYSGQARQPGVQPGAPSALPPVMDDVASQAPRQIPGLPPSAVRGYGDTSIDNPAIAGGTAEMDELLRRAQEEIARLSRAEMGGDVLAGAGIGGGIEGLKAKVLEDFRNAGGGREAEVPPAVDPLEEMMLARKAAMESRGHNRTSGQNDLLASSSAGNYGGLSGAPGVRGAPGLMHSEGQRFGGNTVARVDRNGRVYYADDSGSTGVALPQMYADGQVDLDAAAAELGGPPPLGTPERAEWARQRAQVRIDHRGGRPPVSAAVERQRGVLSPERQAELAARKQAVIDRGKGIAPPGDATNNIALQRWAEKNPELFASLQAGEQRAAHNKSLMEIQREEMKLKQAAEAREKEAHDLKIARAKNPTAYDKWKAGAYDTLEAAQEAERAAATGMPAIGAAKTPAAEGGIESFVDRVRSAGVRNPDHIFAAAEREGISRDALIDYLDTASKTGAFGDWFRTGPMSVGYWSGYDPFGVYTAAQRRSKRRGEFGDLLGVLGD